MIKSVLLRAAQESGQLMKDFSAQGFKINSKDGRNDLVTEADHASEKKIMGIIRESFPDHYILTEESGDLPSSSSYKWIIDPIDGTVNFANGIPLSCVSIAIEKDGDMIMGAVYNPFIDEFFFAEKGQGATLNGKPISVSKKESVANAILVTGFPYTYLNEENGPLDTFGRFIRAGIPVRRLGSAAIDLCWVACGRFDGYFEHKLNAWDSAAGFLIVKEAGGIVTDFDGKDYSPYQPKIIATNGNIHNELIRWIQNKV
ncbi:MAG: inositol monophosphatase family protein [Chitinophagaceae bacterium]